MPAFSFYKCNVFWVNLFNILTRWDFCFSQFCILVMYMCILPPVGWIYNTKEVCRRMFNISFPKCIVWGYCTAVIVTFMMFKVKTWQLLFPQICQCLGWLPNFLCLVTHQRAWHEWVEFCFNYSHFHLSFFFPTFHATDYILISRNLKLFLCSWMYNFNECYK